MSELELGAGVQWGKTMIPIFNDIFQKLSTKIDGIETKIDSVNSNIDTIRNEIFSKVEAVQKTADAALKIAEETKKEMKKEISKVMNYCDTLKSENTRLKGYVNHLDNYSRRNNLVIGGIEESNEEHCEQLVLTFFKDKLKLDDDTVNAIKIDRCHRLGKRLAHVTRPRSLIVRFRDFSDRQCIWIAKKNLVDKSVHINEHFSGDTEFKRR